jgi:ATP-binding cassette subfamily A (ABC1) protein 3
MNFQFSMIQLVKMKALAGLGPVREIPSSLTAISDYPLAAGFAFFIIDTLLYTFLAWYFAQILGGSEEFGGSPKKWYFLFTKSYWIKTSSHKRAANEESVGLLSGSHVNVDDYDMEEPSDDHDLSADLSSPSKPPRRDPAHFEPYHGNPTDLRIRTRKLVKRYKGSEVNAVNGLDLDIFQGIYVLLGENGSGKSTTISMLTGLIPLTNGSAEVDGADVSTQLDFVRNSISICPQHDLLSDRLSGAEHLRLFGRLKGVPLDELEARIVDTLNDVGLGTAGDQLVETYSGGMKRSLSLGISLIAHSSVVFIDEASSGMDMEKRRTLWDMLLRKKKEGSTLVLTTHYMEEAEILGDRIGIMHRGNLVREGSLDFLKRELGYQIHTSQPKGSSSSASQANVELLPLSRRDELPEKLKVLESAFEHVAVTTPNLEEVFVQLGKSLDKDDASIDNGHGNYSSTSKKSALAIDTPAPAPRSQQILAYWKKRARAETRNTGTILCFILAPILITALGLAISRISTHYMNELPKAMQLSKASGDPMSLNFANAHFPTQVPYGSPNSQPFLSDWGSSTPGLEMKYIGAPLASLSDYLWSGKDSKLANLGGLFVFSQSSSHPDVSGTYHVGIEYNQTEVYSLNRLVNFVDNAIARHYLNLTSPAPNARDQPMLGVRSVPFPDKSIKSDDSLVLQMLSNGLVLLNTQFAYMMCMCFALLGGLVGKQITEDMEKQVIPQLRRVGMASSTFWIANLLFNMGRMIISGLLAMAVVACFKVTIVMGTSFLPFALSTILQACTTVLLSVLISKIFTSAASAQRFIPLILVLLVMIPSTLQSMMSAMSNMFKNPNNPLQTISTIIPLVSPMSSLIAVVNKIGSAYTASWGTPSLSIVLSPNHTGIPLLVQVTHLVVLVITLAVVEYFKAKIRTTPKDEAPGMANIPTPGVPPTAGLSTTNSGLSKGALGLNSSMENDASSVPLEDSDEGLDEISVQLRHVWKRYRFAQRRAVIDTSLSVPRGICFGLLGPNGAGKSTTISMLIGDVSPSGGSYSLDGIEAIGKSQNDLYHQVRLACCLQVNSLYDDMSVKEHIELYLLLRNNRTDFDLDKATREIMQRMKLSPHSHKLAKQLSGGNKRKLCTALAALTFQSIVVLDEPSTGCDPSMRRTLWQVIKAEQAQKALILTTHSMDEADAVCNRIAIMLNGQVVSLGTPQALKAQCGGYELQLRLPAASPQATDDSANQIAALEDEFLKPNFPASILIDRDTSHDGSIVLKYDLGLVPSISAAFAILHSAFKEGRFSDYSLSQMTLGTAYQRLVRQQLDEGAPVFGKQ